MDTTENDPNSPLVLVVDDDPDTASLVKGWLTAADFRVRTFDSAETFLAGLETSLPDAVCLDIGLPGLSGMEALEVVRARHAQVPVLMVSANDAVESVVNAMQRGAADYLAKPLDEVRLLTAVHNMIERYRARAISNELQRAAETGHYRGMVGRSAVMHEVFRQLDRVAESDISVLVHGESGTGKELAARAIHDRSHRRNGPFVGVNCAAIPETLQDSELFGHEKGAFTGAVAQRQGRFEQAHRGTLFLDEVAELSPSAQAKLLRVLQEHRFERVGGARSIESDFRLIAASHRNLRERVQQGTFREDLFFRIAVFELELPALREREGDVELLVSQLLQASSKRRAGVAWRVSEAALECLCRYDWPGNVRELANVLERAAVIADGGVIELRDLPPQLRGKTRAALESAGEPAPVASTAPVAPAAPKAAASTAPRSPSDTAPVNLDDLERWAIEQAIEQANGNMAEVVRRLGIGKTTLYRKLKKYGLL